MNNDISKQEYLKRYLEGNDKEKKHKKKIKISKSIIPRIKIVDEDISIKTIKFGTKEEVDEDECPVVAEVIDDRPIEIKSKEIYVSSRWKTIGEDDSEISDVKKDLDSHKIKKHSVEEKISRKKIVKSSKRHDSDSDLSPVPVRHDSDGDLSPVRGRHDSDSDLSPVRTSQRHTSLSKHNHNSKSSSNKEKILPDHHPSPKRDSRQKSNTKKANNSDSDLSPERLHSKRSRTNSIDDNDSDLSPPRKTAVSPNKRKNRRKDLSVSCANEDADSDLSPPRKNTFSPPRSSSSSASKNRPKETLSGLKAGLQNATTLREETKELRKREKVQIKQLDAELSGRNADTVVRDRRTGKRVDVDAELRITAEKEKKNSEQQQKYSEWGKGIQQTENKKMKLSEDLYEMSKPLARYCDDEDLEERLKAEIRDDDPMAQYMRKKKRNDVVSAYPMYKGPPPPPNRFQIPPGYRWDGVDRSNGFEKKYFEQKSAKKANEVEAYLWSIQDM